MTVKGSFLSFWNLNIFLKVLKNLKAKNIGYVWKTKFADILDSLDTSYIKLDI